jgi:hypothetical protein
MKRNNIVRITKTQLKEMIYKSVKQVLKESIYDTTDGFESTPTRDDYYTSAYMSGREEELVKKIKRLDQTKEWPIMGLSIPVEKGKVLCVGVEGNSVKCGVLTQGGPRPIYYEDMSKKDQMSVYNAVNDNLKSEY